MEEGGRFKLTTTCSQPGHCFLGPQHTKHLSCPALRSPRLFSRTPVGALGSPRPGLCSDSPLLSMQSWGGREGVPRTATWCHQRLTAVDYGSPAAAPGRTQWATAWWPAWHPWRRPPVLSAGTCGRASGHLPRLPVVAPTGPLQHCASCRPRHRAHRQPQGGCTALCAGLLELG